MCATTQDSLPALLKEEKCKEGESGEAAGRMEGTLSFYTVLTASLMVKLIPSKPGFVITC